MIKQSIQCLLIVYCSLISAKAQPTNMLEDLIWKNRIILTFAENDTTSQYRRQKKLWENASKGLDERDIVVFSVFTNEVKGAKHVNYDKQMAANLRKVYEVEDGQFAVVLIGKDGGQKLKNNQVVTTDQLFAIIDAMPMRRREMEESKNK